MPLQQYKISNITKGQDRSKARNLIDDRSLWTAKNVRFDEGVIVPILEDTILKTKSGITTGYNRYVIPVITKEPLWTKTAGEPRNIALLGYNESGVNDLMLYHTADTYATELSVGGAQYFYADFGYAELWRDAVYFCTGGEITGGKPLWYTKGGGTTNITEVSNYPGDYCMKIQAFRDFLFAMDSEPGNPPTLYWSEVNDPTTWTGGETGSKVYEQYIQSIHKLRNTLYVFLEKKIYGLQYIGLPTVWSNRLIAGDVGCWGPYAVNEIPNGLVFISDLKSRDVFLSHGSSLQSIGKPIEALLFTTMLENDAKKMSVTGNAYSGSSGAAVLSQHNPKKNEVVFMVTDYVTDTKQYYLIYNYALNSWSYGDMTYLASTDLFITCMASNWCDTVRFATTDKASAVRVHEFGTGTTTRAFDTEFKLFDFKRPDIYKRLLKVQLIFSGVITEDKDAYVRIDYADSPGSITSGTVHTVELNATTNVVEIFCDVSAKYFTLRFYSKDTAYATSWKLSDVIFHFKPRGAK